jgi:outer membrane receptor protein involved in Fe transport
MRKFGLLGTSAIRSAAFIGFSMAFAAPALAQGTTAPQDADPAELQSETEVQSGVDAQTGAQGEGATAGGDQTITVTGSRIRRPNLESTVPITSIGGEQFFQTGDTNIGDTLNDLPQLRSTFAQQNPGLGIGIAGLNLLDLRGLGTSRTLVLVNGRRHVPADILNNAVSPDINTIPNDLIERVDIVTGSQSATYGSDAIAGVVNFILRRNFDGIQVRGQAGIADGGFGGNQYVSAMVGRNFMGDRANITLHGEYAKQDRVFASHIDHLRTQNGFLVVDVDTAGLPNGSDNFPDRTFFRDIRSASINRFGLVPITQAGTTTAVAGGTLPAGTVITATPQACGQGIGSTNGGPGPGSGASVGTPYNCTFLFTPTSNLIPQTGTRTGQGIIGGIVGGNGQTGREGQLLSVFPFVERYNFNLLAHFSVSDAFEPFLEAKWNRVNALGNNAGPSFIQGTFGQFDTRERVRLDNPFLSPADRTAIANAILASGCNTSLTAPCAVPGVASSFNRTTRADPTLPGSPVQGIGGPLNAADRAAIAAGTYRFVLARQLADAGIRDEQFQRDTYRIVGGVRGTFNEDWNYELAVNYGKFKQDVTTFGFLDRQRFLLSLDAGRNPATGQIQCRSQFDPAARVPFAGSDARLAADVAACVPYNPFGGSDNSAAVDYFSVNAKTKAGLEQFDVLGYVGGDTSQIFELPGGPISFVLGGEYRRERARYEDDDFVESGATNAVIIGEFDPPTFKVKEAFAEIRIPILRDMPFFHELTVTGAGRVSDYNSAVGTVYTYNVGGDWAPVRDLRFRAGYGKAVRAPNVSETGFPAVPNFAPGFLDPCASGQIANNPNRQANCQEALGALLPSLPNVAYSLPIISGSNPNLAEETSKSLTVGGVFQPRFVPGFSLSVDYYDIKVSNVIVSLSAQAIANGCYDQPSLQNPLCGVFERFMGPGTSPGGFAPGQILENSLVSAPVNFAKLVRRGIDVNAAYRTRFGKDVRFDANLIYVHNLQTSNFLNPSDPNFENRILGEVGDPKDEFRLDADLRYKAFTFGYRLRYIGPAAFSAFEDANPLDSACSAAGCPPNNADFADRDSVPAVWYHDIRFAWDLDNLGGLGKSFQFYFGVDNLLNRKPPLGIAATGTGPGGVGNGAIYDIRGRNFYGGFRARF